jgi:hypothetical protein
MLVELPHHPATADVVASPLLYATAGAHGAGFLLLQRAFQSGSALASLSALTAAMNLVPMLAGVLLLGERLPAGHLALVLRIAAFAAAVAGAAVLSVRSAAAPAPSPAAAEQAGWLHAPPAAAR